MRTATICGVSAACLVVSMIWLCSLDVVRCASVSINVGVKLLCIWDVMVLVSSAAPLALVVFRMSIGLAVLVIVPFIMLFTLL